MIQRLRTFIVAVCAAFSTGCSDAIPASEAKARIRNGALAVDVRTPAEFASGHLSGALLIPHTELDARLSELGDDRSREIVFYCRSGRRSGIAVGIARKHGFSNVWNGGSYSDLK